MDWIQSKQVMDAMGVRWSRSGSVEAQRLCKRAEAGLLQARARKFCRGDDCRQDVPVPPEFWWAGGAAALDQDWEVGDFSTWPKLNGRESCEWRAFGVEWSAEDLKSMGIDVLATDNGTNGTAERTSAAGRKVDSAKWQAFWFAAIELANAERLKPGSFESAAALREELLSMMGKGAFNPDYVKAVVGQIFKKFVGS